ncbi:MAG TPA: class I adenylate-forming enzyme family protein [Candidatus Deferrimicrobium sp.]|nr:class I adenylate-forming enzyme family protein [Candidatus Deferrimicrobium sp.]
MGKSPFKAYLDIKARHYPIDRVALVYGDKKITWKELQERVNRLGNALRKSGVKKRDKVAFVFWNSPEFMETHLAIQALGAIAVPLNYMYSHTEYKYAIDFCDAVALVIDNDVRAEIEKIRPELTKVKTFICHGLKDSSDWIDYEEVIRTSSKKNVKVKGRFTEFDEALICYTGGTTGRPKGVVLTYDNFISNLEMTSTFLASFLPPVSEFLDEEYAKNEFQRKMQDVIDALGLGSAVIKLDFEKEFKGKTVVLITETDKGISLPPMTITQRIWKEGTENAKIFKGMRDDLIPDLKLYYKIGEQIRHGASKLPMSYSRWGKILMLPSILKRYLFGGIKIEGEKKLRLAIIKGMLNKGTEEIVPSCTLPPFFHSAAYVTGIVTWILYGQPLIFPVSKKFDIREILELIEKENLKMLFMVPLQWKRLLEYPDIDKYNLDSVKVAISGGSLFKGQYKKLLLNTFKNALIIDGFGQTEMSPIVSLKLDASPEHVIERSIGHEIDGLEVKIINPETGEEIPDGEIGELIYKSVTIMKEYYKDPEKTIEVLKDGWFRGGDLGYRKEGQLFIVDRVKECIISGAEKIFPLEVEEIIYQHPKVSEVCVIGVPDEEWGSAVRAVIIPKKGLTPGKDIIEEEIIEFCRGKMASYKKPKSVIFVKILPVSPVGKVLRAKVRELYSL